MSREKRECQESNGVVRDEFKCRILRVADSGNTNRTAIMKWLETQGERARQRFMRQVAILREQPAKGGMPEFYDSGVHEGAPYCVMEEVAPLANYLPPAEAIAVVRDVANACRMLRTHKNEYFHCGIHPVHIGRRPDGHAVLLGFGWVFTKNQALVAPSTIDPPLYLAPEDLSEGWISECAEIYALGKLLSELMNDKVPSELASVVADATAEDPKKRIQSIPELLVRLEGKY